MQVMQSEERRSGWGRGKREGSREVISLE